MVDEELYVSMKNFIKATFKRHPTEVFTGSMFTEAIGYHKTVYDILWYLHHKKIIKKLGPGKYILKQ